MIVPGKVLRWRESVRAALNRGAYTALRIELVLAIIWQESEGDPSAFRYEHGYRWLWNVKTDAPFRRMTVDEIFSAKPPHDFPYLAVGAGQEWTAQRCSWGLMQIMGAAARERRFKAHFIPELIHDTHANIEYGIKHLWDYAYQYGNRSTESALLRWNGGGDKEYPDKILTKLGEIEKALV